MRNQREKEKNEFKTTKTKSTHAREKGGKIILLLAFPLRLSFKSKCVWQMKWIGFIHELCGIGLLIPLRLVGCYGRTYLFSVVTFSHTWTTNYRWLIYYYNLIWLKLKEMHAIYGFPKWICLKFSVHWHTEKQQPASCKNNNVLGLGRISLKYISQFWWCILFVSQWPIHSIHDRTHAHTLICFSVIIRIQSKSFHNLHID